ncbi:MAG: TonB-dependent receptor [Myxococcales bacterium]|nr:TonB-dependent receptor [Myxococcales bacterium]
MAGRAGPGVGCGAPRRLWRLALPLVVMATLGRCRAARADTPDVPEFGATAEVSAPLAATHDLDPSASGTSLDLEGRPETGLSARDVLPEVPGARPLATGAGGTFTSLSLRGADASQTTVLLGTLPLSSPDGGAFDLSLLPLSSFGRVQVFRGGAPLWLGEGAIGGVIQYLPPDHGASYVEAAAGGGSFGTWSTRLRAQAVGPRALFFTSASLDGTAGDYPYVDDRGTRFDPTDDVTRRRRNADNLTSSGLSYLRAEVAGGTVEATFFAVERQGGFPGVASRPALHARSDRAQYEGALSYRREGVTARRALPYRYQLLFGVGAVRDRFTDRFGEVGQVRSVTDDRTRTIFGRAVGSIEPLGWLELTALGTARRDGYRPDDAFAVPGEQGSARVTGVLGAEARVHGRLGPVRVEVRPSARVELSRASLSERHQSSVTTRRVRELAPTARVGFALSPARPLTLTASFATGTRLPSILELFGDRATLRPNPTLSPERARSFDGGVVARGEVPGLRPALRVGGTLEAHAFGRRSEDLIRYRRVSRGQATAENIARGTVRGVDARAAGDLTRYVSTSATVTWMRSSDGNGHRLPLLSPLSAYARLAVHSRAIGRHLDDLVVYVEVTHLASGPTDPANLVPFPGRTTWGGGVRAYLFDRALSVALSARDLADARGFDLLGFPLPGRRYAAALSYRKELR